MDYQLISNLAIIIVYISGNCFPLSTNLHSGSQTSYVPWDITPHTVSCIIHILYSVFVCLPIFSFWFQSQNAANPLGDDRFAAMFSDPNFQIDEDSEVSHYTHYITYDINHLYV